VLGASGREKRMLARFLLILNASAKAGASRFARKAGAHSLRLQSETGHAIAGVGLGGENGRHIQGSREALQSD
jgi:hypothetical protein